MPPQPDLCLYAPETAHIFSDITDDQIAAPPPGLIVIPLDDAMLRHDASTRTAPVEIDRDRYSAMLHLLPPLSFHDTRLGQSFQLAEPISGFITPIFVAIAGRYFEFADHIRLTHAQRCVHVRLSAAYLRSPATMPLEINELSRRFPDTGAAVLWGLYVQTERALDAGPACPDAIAKALDGGNFDHRKGWKLSGIPPDIIAAFETRRLELLARARAHGSTLTTIDHGHEFNRGASPEVSSATGAPRSQIS